MKRAILALYHEILDFIKNDFHLLSYLYTFVFVVICIYLNYTQGFYRIIMRESYFEGNSTWMFPLFYASMYFSVAIPTLIFRKKIASLKNWKFYAKSLLLIGIYGFSIGFFSYKSWTFGSMFYEETRYVIKLISQLKSFVFYFLPLLFMKLTFDKHVEGMYGLSKSSQHIKGYLSMFLMLLPFLILISYTADFQHAYPQFKFWEYEGVFGMQVWQYSSIFELTYAFDFIMTELMFRGALVIGMVAILGRDAILPMVAMYVAIHFGKPVGETVSSLFGGFLLGALAYQTRHIWGGVIVHILIALSMEVLGFFHFFVTQSNH